MSATSVCDNATAAPAERAWNHHVSATAGSTAKALTPSVQREGVGSTAARAMSAVVTTSSMRYWWSMVAPASSSGAAALVQARNDTPASRTASARAPSCGPRATSHTTPSRTTLTT
jgi:hypothetical protein